MAESAEKSCGFVLFGCHAAILKAMTTSAPKLMEPRFFCRLPYLRGFTVSGNDAVEFLHGQLTNDVKAANVMHAQRTGFCTAKGRLISVMLQWKDPQGSVHHILPADLKTSVTKRLKMFVLRAKAQFSPDDESPEVICVWGHPVGEFPVGSVKPLANQGFALRLEDCPVLGARILILQNMISADASISADTPERLLSSVFGQSEIKEIDSLAWRFSEINCGLSWVWQQTQEAFVPQMINLELTNGVSFTKGCYPGQEVVARSQYLGKLKRRTFRCDLAQFDSGITPGTDIWSAADASQPSGVLVDIAPRFSADCKQDKGAVALIETTIDAWESSYLRLQTLDGPRLIPATLPYAFPAAA